MKSITFVTRHQPTMAQTETMKAHLGFEEVKHLPGVVFPVDPNQRVTEILEKAELQGPDVGIVAPTWVVRRLLLEGRFTRLYEFVNFPSARERGIFLCKGVVLHTPEAVEFFECPVPPEEQEEQALRVEGK